MAAEKYTTLWTGDKAVWDHADKNKIGTLYRAMIKFDRGIKYTGANKEEILKLTNNKVSFDGDALIVEHGRYPVGVMVCVSLIGQIDIWDEATFLTFFEPWPEDGSRSSSRRIEI